jgi:hypothetical protein
MSNNRKLHLDPLTGATVLGDPSPYLRVEDHGSICLITPVGREAVDWLEATAPEDAQWWAGRSLVVEPRYVQGVLDAWENRND